MSKNKTIKTHLSAGYKNKLIQKANSKGMSTTEYLTQLIYENLYTIPPHKLDYLVSEHATLGIRVDEELYHRLSCKVQFENMNISEYLRELIYQDIRNGE